MFFRDGLTLFVFEFILWFLIVSSNAAPANVTDIIEIPELLRTERAERLLLQKELDSLTDKFTILESSLHMQRDGGKLYFILNMKKSSRNYAKRFSSVCFLKFGSLHYNRPKCVNSLLFVFASCSRMNWFVFDAQTEWYSYIALFRQLQYPYFKC